MDLSVIMHDFRQEFPFFNNHPECIYLDSAATTHKPQCVIDAITHAQEISNANVHRSSYHLAATVTERYELVRTRLAQLIHAPASQNIFWTKGATEALNLIAYGLGELCLAQHPLWQGNEIIVLTSEHHANILPWQQLVQRINQIRLKTTQDKSIKKLRVTTVSPDMQGNYQYDDVYDAITDDTALIAVAHVSNALGCIHPIDLISRKAHQHKALCIVDGTQALAHISVDVQTLGCDAYVGSSHKMFGPTGVGFGYGTYELLNALPPYQVGGEMIEYVSFSASRFQSFPYKFEAGTPNIHGVLGFGAAIDFIETHRDEIQTTENQLFNYLLMQLSQITQVRILGQDNTHKISLCSMVLTHQHKPLSHYDVLRWLDNANIALRVGHHCAMPLMQHLQLDGTLRVSLSAYNTMSDIDRFIATLKDAIQHLIVENHADSIHADSIDGVIVSEHDVKSVLLPLARQFGVLQGYENIFRQIMLSSKALPQLSADEQIESYHVAGCEVDVWVKYVSQSDSFEAFANSKIIRGLLAILLEKANALSHQQRAQFDFAQYLTELGITHHLSQSRVNGLSRVIAQLSA